MIRNTRQRAPMLRDRTSTVEIDGREYDVTWNWTGGPDTWGAEVARAIDTESGEEIDDDALVNRLSDRIEEDADARDSERESGGW